ncbi:MAG: C2H2-type zinc finger protein, partial [Candidatus Babeliales bacterium]
RVTRGIKRKFDGDKKTNVKKEKAHVCDTCGEVFAYKSHLVRHARTHTPKFYQCTTCGVGYLKEYPLTQHIKRVHKPTQETEHVAHAPHTYLPADLAPQLPSSPAQLYAQYPPTPQQSLAADTDSHLQTQPAEMPAQAATSTLYPFGDKLLLLPMPDESNKPHNREIDPTAGDARSFEGEEPEDGNL